MKRYRIVQEYRDGKAKVFSVQRRILGLFWITTAYKSTMDSWEVRFNTQQEAEKALVSIQLRDMFKKERVVVHDTKWRN